MAIQAQLYAENIGFAFGSSQDFVMDNACGSDQFSFNLQQRSEKQLQQQMQFQSLGNQNACFDNCSLLQKNTTIHVHPSTTFSQSLTALVEKQKIEIDRVIYVQNERLRWALKEERKRQVALILSKYETKTQLLLRQKDEEIAKAANRSTQLEDVLKRMEIEKQAWQKLAKENEAMVSSLNSTIEQLRESARLSSNAVEDAESCCDVIEYNRAEEEELEVGHEHQQQQHITRNMVCKGCNCRCSSIIILPCRHLCLCKACEAFLALCPLCGTEKKATIEALI